MFAIPLVSDLCRLTELLKVENFQFEVISLRASGEGGRDRGGQDEEREDQPPGRVGQSL